MCAPILVLGASGEVGSHISQKFSDLGYPLILHGYKNTPSLTTSTTNQQNIKTVKADLTDESAVEKLFASIQEENDSLSAVVFSVARRFENRLCYRTKWNVFDEQIQSQLKAAHLAMSAAFPLLRSYGNNNTARVLVVSSEYSLGVPPIKAAPYVTAKSALNAYALSIAQEWLSSNIRVHIMAPGILRSNLTEHMPDLFFEEMIKTLPEKRLTDANDVANFAEFLMSDAADVLYGTILPVTRGKRVGT